MTFMRNYLSNAACAVLAAGLAAPAVAEGGNYVNYRGGYTSDGDYSLYGLIGERDLSFGNGFEASIAGGYSVASGFFTDKHFFALGTIGYNIGSNVTPYVRLGFDNWDSPFFNETQTTYGLGVDWRGAQFATGLEYRVFDHEFGEFETLQFAAIYSPTDNIDVYAGALDYVGEDFTLYSLGTDLQLGGFRANVGLLMDEDFLSDAYLTSRFEYGFAPGDSIFGPSSFFGNELFVFAGVNGPLDALGDYGTREFGLGLKVSENTRIDLSYLDYVSCESCDEDISLYISFEKGKKRLRVVDEFNDASSRTTPNSWRTYAYTEYYGAFFD